MTRWLWFCALAALVRLAAPAAPSADDLGGMRWRLVGPNRAGRAWTVAGVPGDAAVYYLGTPAGALWKTTNGGTTWRAISDALPVTGIGAVAVAPSVPDVVYIGTGSNTLGAGVFRSADAGATWSRAGLDDSKYITGLLVDPRDANVVIAGVGSGGNFGSMVFYNNAPSAQRGIYRTTDGGRTWAHTLFVNDASSLVDLAADPSVPDTMFATFTGDRQSTNAPSVYVSHDAGRTWSRSVASGLPPSAGAVNLAVAANTSARRLYALTGGRGGGGLYRSDDGGETWTLGTSRLASAGGHLYVDPHNPDVVYTMGTSVYRSTDGGRTLEAIKGAPGGDDPHAMWIDPRDPRRMIVGADQGPTISVDGGASWTPWYVLPNGELYFVSTDAQFPYRVYAAQQDSGTVSILSRSDYGAIRPNDWYPVRGYEQGHIFSDPLNPRYVYSHGDGHAIVRFDRETGQAGPVYTPAAEDRFGPRPGMDLSRKDPHWMFVGAQYVLASNDRITWTKISPDLTARSDAATSGRQANGTIVALAASPLDLDVLWAATSNGIIQVTRDRGKSWSNVSPPALTAQPALTPWSLEASPHDAAVAYATAIDLSDRHGPCLLMTTDFGATWREIDNGLPADVPTRVVREDPERPDLLYAGTQSGAFVSFDRGAHWTSLQLNLPRITVNDITVHANDLVIATWGRGLWILDDVSPLRQREAVRSSDAAAYLLSPAAATRVRWDNNSDTPLPPEVPTGENPPDGAVIDYYLRGASPKVSIAIRDSSGRLVREFTNAVPPPDTRMPNVPDYWFAAPEVTGTAAGMHRLVWDLRDPAPPPLDYGSDGAPSTSVSYGIIAPAIAGHSPRQQPRGALVSPGTYRVTLTANGITTSRDLHVVNDPRSVVSPADLESELEYERGLETGIARSHDAIEAIRSLREQAHAHALPSKVPGVQSAAAAFDRAALASIAALARGRSLTQHLAALEGADLRPTASTITAVRESCATADEAVARYARLLSNDLTVFNEALSKSGLPPLESPPLAPRGACDLPR